jgi:hypothetical protein
VRTPTVTHHPAKHKGRRHLQTQAATLWVSSLTVPPLAERVHDERREDLDIRSGKIMTLFNCAKIVNDASTRESSIFEPTLRLAEKLNADLR